MAKNKDNEIQKGPDSNQVGMTAEEIAAAAAAITTTPEATKADAKVTKPAKPAKAVPGVRITAKVASFRRAGFTFGLTPVDLTLSELSKEQCAALADEPMLTCEPIEFPVEAQAEA